MKTWKEIEKIFEEYDTQNHLLRMIQTGQSQYDEESLIYQRYEIQKLEETEKLSKIKQKLKSQLKEAIDEICPDKWPSAESIEIFEKMSHREQSEDLIKTGFNKCRQEMLDKLNKFFE